MFDVILNENMKTETIYHADDYVDALNYATYHRIEAETIDIYKDHYYFETLK